MKQLVSRNPIERFRQVVKAQNGVPLRDYKAGKVQKGWKEAGQYDQTINNLTAQQKDWLDSQGINYTKDAGTMQASMVNYLAQNGNINHGLRLDGHWGDQSGRTLNAILAQMPADYKRRDTEPVDAPVVTTPAPTTPNLGYRSTFNYADGQRDFGFNNYRGMVAFANTYKDDPFAQDLRKRFGDDPNAWVQSDVENALHVKGKYRRGAGGDMHDMMVSMADWAGGMNRQYDDKYKAYRAAQQVTEQAAPPMDDAVEFYKWAQTQPGLMDKYKASKNPNQHSPGYVHPAER